MNPAHACTINNFMIIATQTVTPPLILTPVLEMILTYTDFAYNALHTVLQRNVLPADNSSINGNNILFCTQ